MLVCVLSSNVQSEVYQWKDKHGKIHFSDKKPKDKIPIDRVEIKKNKNIPEFNEVKSKKPIYNFGRNNKTKKVRIVVIDIPVINVDKKGHNKTPVGIAYFGENCLLPTTMYIEDLADSYKFLVSEGYGGLDEGISDEMDRNNYYNKTTRPGFAIHEATKYGGYILEAEVNELNILSCYFNTKVKHVYRLRNDLKKIKWRNGKASKAYIKIHWKLKDAKNGRIVYSGNTEGSFDHWTNYINKHIHHSVLQTVKKATEVATRNLLSDERFVALIRTNPESSAKTKSKLLVRNNIHSISDLNSSGTVKKSKGLIGDAMQTAKLASVMNVIRNLKGSVSSYYLLNGQLPSRLSDLDINNPDKLTNPRLVKYYTVDEGGVIAVHLSNSFGNNAKLVFIPKTLDQIGLMQWKCHGNLSEKILSNLNCRSF